MVALDHAVVRTLLHGPLVNLQRVNLLELLVIFDALFPWSNRVRPSRHVLVSAHLRELCNAEPLFDARLVDLEQPSVGVTVGAFQRDLDKVVTKQAIVNVNG